MRSTSRMREDYAIKRIGPVSWKIVVGGHHDLPREGQRSGTWSSLAEAHARIEQDIQARQAILKKYENVTFGDEGEGS